MSKLPGKWKDVPIHKIIDQLGHPANVIDDNDETYLDRCKRVKELNQFVQDLMDNGALTSSVVREIWDMKKNNHMKKEKERKIKKERIRTTYNRLRDVRKQIK